MLHYCNKLLHINTFVCNCTTDSPLDLPNIPCHQKCLLPCTLWKLPPPWDGGGKVSTFPPSTSPAHLLHTLKFHKSPHTSGQRMTQGWGQWQLWMEVQKAAGQRQCDATLCPFRCDHSKPLHAACFRAALQCSVGEDPAHFRSLYKAQVLAEVLWFDWCAALNSLLIRWCDAISRSLKYYGLHENKEGNSFFRTTLCATPENLRHRTKSPQSSGFRFL